MKSAMFFRYVIAVLVSLWLVSCSSFDYGFQQPSLQTEGWIEISQADAQLKRTIRQRVREERTCVAVDEVIRRLGFPDIYHTDSLWSFYYVFVAQRLIYRFEGVIFNECEAKLYASNTNYPSEMPFWVKDKLNASQGQGGDVFERPPDV